MNTKTLLLLAVTAATLLILGWLAGGASNVVEAQSQSEIEAALLQGYEWRMFGGNVAGTGGSGGGGGSELLTGSRGATGNPVIGATWLYNTKTGKVYRVWNRCGDDDPNGCLTALPVYYGSPLDTYLPNPAIEDPLGMER